MPEGNAYTGYGPCAGPVPLRPHPERKPPGIRTVLDGFAGKEVLYMRCFRRPGTGDGV